MREKGLSLMEILVAMAIATAVGGLLLVIVLNSTGVYYKESSKLQEGVNTNDIQASIRESIKNASAISASYVFGGTTYTSNPTQIVFKVPAIDASNNIISNTFDYFVYFLDTNKLRLKTFPDFQSSRKAQDQIFSTILDSLNFQYFNSATPPIEVSPSSASKVRITLTLKQKSGSNFEIHTATSEANLRND